jgi:hypothetical protein
MWFSPLFRFFCLFLKSDDFFRRMYSPLYKSVWAWRWAVCGFFVTLNIVKQNSNEAVITKIKRNSRRKKYKERKWSATEHRCRSEWGTTNLNSVAARRFRPLFHDWVGNCSFVPTVYTVTPTWNFAASHLSCWKYGDARCHARATLGSPRASSV